MDDHANHTPSTSTDCSVETSSTHQQHASSDSIIEWKCRALTMRASLPAHSLLLLCPQSTSADLNLTGYSKAVPSQVGWAGAVGMSRWDCWGKAPLPLERKISEKVEIRDLPKLTYRLHVWTSGMTCGTQSKHRPTLPPWTSMMRLDTNGSLGSHANMSFTCSHVPETRVSHSKESFCIEIAAWETTGRSSVQSMKKLSELSTLQFSSGGKCCRSSSMLLHPGGAACTHRTGSLRMSALNRPEVLSSSQTAALY